MLWQGGLNVPEQSEKVKIKLSELTEMYDIEEDVFKDKDIENIPEKESNASVETNEEVMERKEEEEFDNA